MKAPQGLHLSLPDSEVLPVLRRILANATIGVVLMDHRGHLVGANREHFRLTGMSESLLAEQSFDFNKFLSGICPAAGVEVARILGGGACEQGEYYWQADSRRLKIRVSERLHKGIWVSMRGYPILDDRNQVRYAVLLFDDVTERKELEGVILQSRKMEAIATLAGGLAHDLNNILSGVVGYASLLVARLPKDSQDEQAARTILDAADRAANLASQLLTVSRRSFPVLAPLDLGELLPRTATLLARRFQPNHLIELDIASDLVSVDADLPQMEQVVVNLCMNARDAMPRGGTVTIMARNRSFSGSDARPLPTMPFGDYVEIRIIDHGVGMSPDIVSRVFEPFFSTKEMGHGTGLGLAVVYGIVKSHHGFAVVDSAPGEGTTVSLFLPQGRITTGSAADQQALSSSSMRVPSSKSVLVIDDDPMVRRVLLDMLARLGHMAIEASGMDPAMDLLLRDPSRFEVLLVDVFMPERSGFELVEALRKAGFDVPVILCTGFSSAEVQSRARSLTGTTVLGKPFDVQGLSDAIYKATRSLSHRSESNV